MGCLLWVQILMYFLCLTFVMAILLTVWNVVLYLPEFLWQMYFWTARCHSIGATMDQLSSPIMVSVSQYARLNGSTLMYMVGTDTTYQALFIQGWYIEAHMINMDVCCIYRGIEFNPNTGWPGAFFTKKIHGRLRYENFITSIDFSGIWISIHVLPSVQISFKSLQ